MPKYEYTDFYKTNVDFLRGVIEWGTDKYPGTNRTDNKRLIWRQAGMSESVPADGGWLVGMQYGAEILKVMYEASQLRQFCAYQQIKAGSNKTVLPLLDFDSRKDGKRACLGYWGCEADEKTKSAPKFKRMLLELGKVFAFIPLTDELRDDVVLLENFLRDVGGAELGFQLDRGIIRGTGAGMPLGILNCGCTIQQDKDGGQAADTITLSNLVNMWSRLWLPGKVSKGTKWIIHSELDAEIWNLANASNIVQIPPASGFDTPSIMGAQVLWSEHCSVLGDRGDIILADLAQYQLIDKGTSKATYSIHLNLVDGTAYGFVTDESFMRMVYRVDGGCRPIGPITPAQGTVTTSPLIVLQERT